MLETDADRLASIKGLGGQLVTVGDDSCWAIFDESGEQLQLGDMQINSTSPQLTLRSSDAERLDLVKRHAAVSIDGRTFTAREYRVGQAPGWAVVILDEP